MLVNNLGILLYPGTRAKVYLQNLVNQNLLPSYAVLIMKNEEKKSPSNRRNKNIVSLLNHSFDLNEPLLHTLKRGDISYTEVFAEDCNSDSVIEAVKKRPEKFFLYSGGGILKKPIFETGKKFIHIHPGIIPQYRGSTCFLYSYLNEGKCGATAFIMNEKIDLGEIIAQKEYSTEKVKDLGPLFDAYMRTDLLLDIVKQYAKTNEFKTKPQNPLEGETYFIIHPVLEHLAILSCNKNNP